MEEAKYNDTLFVSADNSIEGGDPRGRGNVFDPFAEQYQSALDKEEGFITPTPTNNMRDPSIDRSIFEGSIDMAKDSDTQDWNDPTVEDKNTTPEDYDSTGGGSGFDGGANTDVGTSEATSVDSFSNYSDQGGDSDGGDDSSSDDSGGGGYGDIGT